MADRSRFYTVVLLLALNCTARVIAFEPPPLKSWPMYQYSATHNAVFFDPTLAASWQFSAGDKINGGLAVVNGTLFFDSFDRKVYALNVSSGAIRWSADAGGIVMSTPVITDGVVVVGTGQNGLLDPSRYPGLWGRPGGDDELAFDTTGGRLLWRYHTIGQDMPSPAIVGDRLVFANGDAHAYAVDLKQGRSQWVTPLMGIATMASMTYDRGHAYTSVCSSDPTSGCETLAIDPVSGSILWKASGGGNDCSPTIADGIIVVNDNKDDLRDYQFGGNDTIFAFDEASGQKLWSYTAPSGPYTSVGSMERQIAGTIHDHVLYQSLSNADLLVALNVKDGRPIWKLRTWAPVKMSPAVTDRNVLFGDIAGLFYVVDRTTGQVKHVSTFLKPFATSPPVVIGDSVFIANGATVYAKRLEDL